MVSDTAEPRKPVWRWGRVAVTPPAPILLALDQGSGSTRVLAFDAKARLVASSSRPLTTRTPQASWVEHDPDELLLGARAALSDAIRTTPGAPRAIGVTTQRSTIVIWERRTGRSLTPAVSWQDRRALDVCRSLRRHGARIKRITGLPLSPHYAAPKLRWLLDRIPNGQRRAERGDLLCGTVNTFLLWHLTGRVSHVTDHTQAARTLLMNLRTLAWDDRLCDLFGVPMVMLPEIRPTIADFGAIQVGATSLPVLASIGDQQAAAFGQGGTLRGDLCLHLGTGAFVLLCTGERLVRCDRLLSSVAWSTAHERAYVLEGGVNAVGSGVRWLSNLIGLPDDLQALDRLAARAQQPAWVLPALAGLAAPHWEAGAEGVIAGLTLATDRAEIVRGFLNGVAFLVAKIVRAAPRSTRFRRVTASGGLAELTTLLQEQADWLGRPIARCRLRETSAWGAAALAGVGAGVWSGLREAAATAPADRVFQPSPGARRVRKMERVGENLVRTARAIAAYTNVNHSS